ncbi:acyl carrier protein [Polynucleobacter sp. AP-Melu-500A-A1]|uniref:acyl carrier protein n=1 Tax=Polynucleobacter sp. AP-Melu-500A-A1 TaxID=2576929 RepID=UPI002103955E|nr:phosphopantetheine-binding protein [Polynucleobacter sp. AP-Melu-500A-A1]
MSNTMNVLLQQVAERFDKNIDEIGPETSLESLGVDSLGKIELLFDLEDHFEVRLPNEDFKVVTLQDVADLIDSAK